MPTYLRSVAWIAGWLVAAGCGDDGVAVAPLDGGVAPDAMTSDVAPCGSGPVTPAAGALDVAEIPLPGRLSACRAAIANGEAVSVGFAADVSGTVLRLDGDLLDPFPARTVLDPGDHDLEVRWDDAEATPDAVRVDVRPDPGFGGETDCGGAVVLHQARSETLGVALLVPGDGRCETTLIAATPLDDLRIQTTARIHVDVALDGAPVGDGDGFSVAQGSHALTLDVDDALDLQRVLVNLAVGTEPR